MRKHSIISDQSIPSPRQDHGSQRTEALDKLEAISGHVLAKHNKVLFLNFSFAYPKLPPFEPRGNEDFSRFLHRQTDNLSRANLDPFYFWIRERDQFSHPFYCLALWLNGSKTQNSIHHFNRARKLWRRILGLYPDDHGLVRNCSGPGVMLRRNSPDFPFLIAVSRKIQADMIEAHRKLNDGFRSFGGSEVPNAAEGRAI